MIKKNSAHIESNNSRLLWTIAQFLVAIALFLFAIDLVSASVTMLGQETAQSILLATSNPFIGLFIGLLATALIQSSSTVTAMTVAVVASGYLSLSNAIPVVMGANVGTTLTSTLVSLGFITNRNEFRKAISAGTIHDFFNIIVVLIIFPLEYYYGALSYCATQLTGLFSGVGVSDVFNKNIDYSYSRVTDWLLGVLPQNIIALIIALVLLFFSIKMLSKIIYTRLIGASKDRLKKYVFNNPYKSFGWGTLVTAGVQSSSITTSLIVPLVASGRVTLTNSFPFIMGANIGTTITALLAAFNKSDAAISLAFVHVLFNLIGVLIFLPFPVIRRIPVTIAYRFGALTLDSRIIGFSYILLSFFLLPFTLIYISRDSAQEIVFKYEQSSADTISEACTIVLKKGAGQNDLQYLVYNGDYENNTIAPDTSFSTKRNALSFVTPDGINNYNLLDGIFNAKGRIIATNDTTSFTVQNLEMRGLRSFEISFEDGSSGTFLVDEEHKVIVRSVYFDTEGRVIQQSKLLAVQ